MSHQFLVAHWTDEALEWISKKCKSYHIPLSSLHNNNKSTNVTLPYKKIIKLPCPIDEDNDNVEMNRKHQNSEDDADSHQFFASSDSNSILPILLHRGDHNQNNNNNSNVMSFIFDHFSQLQQKKIKLLNSFLSSSPSKSKNNNENNNIMKRVKIKLVLINKVANSFLSSIQNSLLVKVFGQCISWSTPISFALSRFGNGKAILQIDVNEEAEEDDDDQEEEVDEEDLENYFRDDDEKDHQDDDDDDDDDVTSNDEDNSNSAENHLSQIFHRSSIDCSNSSSSSFYFSIEEHIGGRIKIVSKRQQYHQKEFFPVRRNRISTSDDNLLLPRTSRNSVNSTTQFPSYLININNSINNASIFTSLPASFVDTALQQQTNYSNPQIHQDVFVFPLVVGSVAKHRGAQATQNQPFEWKIYIRGPHFEDLSSVVEKVVFRLHHTFENPIRVVDKAPFELTDSGWGQFVIGIDVHFISEIPSSSSSTTTTTTQQQLPSNIISSSSSSSLIEKQPNFFDQTSGVAQVDSSSLFSTSQTANLENTSCFPVLKSNAATMVVKLSHFLRFDKGPKNTTTTSSTTNHCIPPLGRLYTNGAENFMPEVSSDGDPCVWEEYDELVFVRPPPRLRLALKHFPYGQEAVPKKNTISWKGYIEKFGLPTSKLVSDEAEYQALVKIHKSLSEFVEEKLRRRALNLANYHSSSYFNNNNNSNGTMMMMMMQQQQPQFSFTTTTSAAANAHVARGWAQWRRQAESILQDLEK